MPCADATDCDSITAASVIVQPKINLGIAGLSNFSQSGTSRYSTFYYLSPSTQSYERLGGERYAATYRYICPTFTHGFAPAILSDRTLSFSIVCVDPRCRRGFDP